MGKTKILIFICFFWAFFGTVGTARADYYAEGALLSTNLLSGKSDVAQITTFKAAGTVPASTTLSVQFSQNGTDWYNSNAVAGGWDSLASGTNSIELRLLDWTTADFYYKLKFTSSDVAATPSAGEIEVDYSDTYEEYVPSWGGGYYAKSDLLSTNILSGTGMVFNGSERFVYRVTRLPSGTSIKVQFSVDGTNFYSSDGTEGGWDTLSFGPHMGKDDSINLWRLNWTGETSFYYKLELATTESGNTPAIGDAGIIQFERSEPIVEYRFDEGYGGTVHNEGIGGTTLNGTLGTGTSAPSWSNDGKFGRALNFDGNDYISVPDFGY